MEADVIICWNHGGVPKGLVEANFKRPTRVISLPNPLSWAKAVEKYWPFPVRGIIKELAPDVIPLRVAALGFSASCQGVAQLLGSQDMAALDAVVAIDGIHTGYVQVDGKKEVNPNGMKPWFEYGKYAVVNERLFVISHSSVVPPTYASTTQTAEWLWNTLTMEPMAFTVPPLPPLNVPATSVHVPAGPSTGKDRTIQYPAPPWKGKRRCGGLVVLGCSNLDGPGTADHIYQAKAMLPLMLQAFLAERWNDIDPKAPGQVCFISGPESPFGWLPRGQVGSAIDVKSSAAKCAGSAVLPPDFIDSKSPAKFAPPLAYSGGSGSSLSTKKDSLLASALLIGAGTLGLWWMASKQRMGALRSNPKRTGQYSADAVADGWDVSDAIAAEKLDRSRSLIQGLNSRDLVAAAVLIKDAPFADEDKQSDWALEQYRKFKTLHRDTYELLHETISDPRDVGRAVSDFMYYTYRRPKIGVSY